MPLAAPDRRKPRIVAHRGGAGDHAQNSLTAFAACVGSGIDGVELDVHFAADGVVVVHHDAWLDRATNGLGPLACQTSVDLARLHLKGGADGVPRLDAALDLLAADPGLELHVEIKTDHTGLSPPRLVDQTLGLLRERDLIDRTVLTSFRLDDLSRAVAAAPGLRTALAVQLSTSWMVGGLQVLCRRAVDLPGCLVSLEALLLKSNLEAMIALAPGRLGVWNADDEASLRFWLDQPIDQIITDQPALALALRDGAD